MADTKLSALTELATEPGGTDELYVNDSGTSKRITYATFKAALLARANHTGTQTASTISDFDTEVSNNADVTANTAKVTNATHTGHISGATVTTIQAAAISDQAEVTAIGTDYILILDTSVSPHALKKALLSDVLDNATHTGQVTGSGALTVQPEAISDQTLATAAGTDYVLILDTSDSPNALKKALISDFASSGGDLKADGTVPLTANWDVGSFDITAEQFHSDIATGTAPLTVASTTVVTNLNADLLDGNHASAFALAGTENATHTGEVTGATALTVAAAAISNRSSVTVAAGDQLLILDVSDSPNALKRISASDFATAAQANATHTGDATGATALTLQASAISGKTEAVSVGTDYLLFLDTSDSPNALKKDAVQDVVNLAKPIEVIAVACSDETTALTTGTDKICFRMPYAFTLSEVRASVCTAPVGSSIIVDINEKVGTPSPDVGTSILSTRLYIDAGEYSSEDASVSPSHQSVISDVSLANDSEITIDIDQVGASTAGAGLKVYLIGRQT